MSARAVQGLHLLAAMGRGTSILCVRMRQRPGAAEDRGHQSSGVASGQQIRTTRATGQPGISDHEDALAQHPGGDDGSGT